MRTHAPDGKLSTTAVSHTRAPLRTRAWRGLFMLALVASAVASGAVMIQVYRSVERELTEAAMARRLSVAQLAATNLTERFSGATALATSLATRVRFADLVSQEKWDEAVQIMRSVPSDFAGVDRVFLSDVHGTLMADTPHLEGAVGKNFAYREWYKGVSRDWQPYITAAYRRTALPQRNVIAVAAPIRSRGAVVGVLVVQSELTTFFDWARALTLGPKETLNVVDANGRAPFLSGARSSDDLVDLSAIGAVQRVRQGGKGVVVEMDPRSGSAQVFGFVPAAHGWGIVTQEPASAAFAARDNQLRRLLVGYALIAAFGAAALAFAGMAAIQRGRAKAERDAAAQLERRVAERTAELDAARREIEERARQLEAVNKELESFSYSVSHDLRAPLRHIHGYAEMLAGDAGSRLSEEAKRCLQVISEASAEMAQLIDDLLAFSRMGRAEMHETEVDLDELVRGAIQGLEVATRGRNIRWSIGPLPRVRGDPSMLKQVYANLLGNAVKYTGPRDPAVIEVGYAQAEDDREVLFVKDNGVGFDMQYADKLFGVFQRLHGADEFEGTGVGLASVRRIIGRHGGRVWAEASPGKGASFYFTLKASTADRERQPGAEP